MLEHPPRNLGGELVQRYEKWLLVQQYAAQTRIRYVTCVRNFLRFLAPRGALATTHADIQAYLGECAQKGFLYNKLRDELHGLRGFFDFLNLGGLMNWVPPRMVRPRSFKREIPRFLTETQVNSLFKGAKTLRERAIVELLYGSGCRMSELRTMRIEDLDFREHRVRVTGKTGRRFLMITSRIARALRAYIGLRREGYVFTDDRKFQILRPKRLPCGSWVCHYRKYQDGSPKAETAYMHIPRGKCRTWKAAQANFYSQARNIRIERPRGLSPLSSSAVERVLRRVGLRVGINFNARVLRHSIATHLMDHDADIRIVQVVLGHASMRTTQIYTHICKKYAQARFEQCHPRK